TGAQSYQRMNFGIFHAGRNFWYYTGDPPDTSPPKFWNGIPHHYFLTPALFWILATLLVWILGLRAGYRLWRGMQPGHAPPRPADPTVFPLAALHAAFVFVFYAWDGSWTYYSYLPVLALLIGLQGHRQALMLRALAIVALAGLGDRLGDAQNRW